MSEPLVVFDGVVKRYGSIAAVKHMDLTIEKGHVIRFYDDTLALPDA